MYNDMKQYFWWPVIKKEIVMYVRDALLPIGKSKILENNKFAS